MVAYQSGRLLRIGRGLDYVNLICPCHRIHTKENPDLGGSAEVEKGQQTFTTVNSSLMGKGLEQ
ncbi:hypothetical protein OUZ56_028657 [Daphnia magna]|uniref:Uncharacterized protein n=1 Tax=Daphnia magna TaxID=35525 RepID=A0ABR0B4K6_9CRUS|nr:hypothetical protein OUZ56_028657 [Daphnia magna]